MRRTSEARALNSRNAVNRIPELYSEAELWHGTGRFSYHGETVVDLLHSILRDGGLIPHLDTWDQKRGPSPSVSVAPARVYARLYAELYRHLQDRNLLRAIRPRVVWSAYFFLSSKWVAWREYSFFQPHIHDVREKAAEWTRRLARKPRSFTGAFLFGASDIPNNYPILIGLGSGAVLPTRGSRFIDLHEQRSAHSIPLASFTHLEVPKKNIEETQNMLKSQGISIPVVSIEEGDAYCWHFPFAYLVRGERLAPIYMRKATSW